MLSQSIKRKRSLPVWATVLIGLVILAIASTVAGSLATLMYVQHLTKNAFDPRHMRSDAIRIAQFPDPLPAGFKYLWAIDFMFMNFIAIQHAPDGQRIVFYCGRGDFADDSKSAVDRAYEFGINTLDMTAKFRQVKERGKLIFQGAEMPYIIGEFIDQSGHKGDGMVGCITVKKAAKIILIYSYSMPGSAYNQDVSTELLKSVKGF